ncbi:Peptidase family S41 [Planctomycetes bacterium Poly30]|uniref:Peptidase family S41 n=1 Tax=Saltatorellus ferox TaxID=2528018 RepID=A0A518ENK6_9BACT|nr:Peptidase family S41 [Planctomycetes bacterium Poly30]
MRHLLQSTVLCLTSGSLFGSPFGSLLGSVLAPALCLVGCAGTAAAQSETLTADRRAAVIDRVCTLLEEKYVFPETATKCAKHLRALTLEGAFQGMADREALAARLTEILQEVGNDQHLLVRLRRPVEATPSRHPALPARERFTRREAGRQQNFGFERVERLEGNVGYVDLRYFAAPSDAMATATAAMGFLANSDALIFDLRKNGGGHPGMVHFLSSFLFEEPTHLNSFYYREGDRTEDYWTLPDVPGPKLVEVPVFVLTGPETFSAAEEFSYNLRTQKRGTLVGETTRGGANPGDLFPIDSTLEIFIPIGRAINPITGTNWEGIGVKPHFEAPASSALSMALEMARTAAKDYHTAIEARWVQLEARLAEAEGAKDGKQAVRVLIDALREAHRHRLLDERDIREVATDLASRERSALSAAVASLANDLYPNLIK